MVGDDHRVGLHRQRVERTLRALEGAHVEVGGQRALDEVEVLRLVVHCHEGQRRRWRRFRRLGHGPLSGGTEGQLQPAHGIAALRALRLDQRDRLVEVIGDALDEADGELAQLAGRVVHITS